MTKANNQKDMLEDYRIRSKEDIEFIENELEKVTVKVVILPLIIIGIFLGLGLIWKIIFIKDPFDQLFSTWPGRIILFCIIMALFRLYEKSKIGKHYREVKIISIGIGMYQKQVSKLLAEIANNDKNAVQEALDGLMEAEEIFSEYDEYQQTVKKAKEFLASQ